MKKGIFLLVIVLVLAGIGYGVVWWKWEVKSPLSRLDSFEVESKPLVDLKKYDFDSLRKRRGVVSEIKMEGKLSGVGLRRSLLDSSAVMELSTGLTKFDSQQFSFESEGEKITGMINISMTLKSNKMPAIVMIRGYADKEGYYTGSGTWRVADELANVGFVTVSIDFLGFGGSETESFDMLEARFEKVPAVMDLIASVKALDFVDENRIGIWAHSNGGQIALSVLEVLGERIPTVLWAPMTNPFPKSVLDTADDLDDGGKLVKKTIADFEKKYDSRRYCFENYYDWIEAPILINQGTNDYWCEVDWQVEVVKELTKRGKEARLQIWPLDDHNLSRNWEEAVQKDIEFYKTEIGI